MIGPEGVSPGLMPRPSLSVGQLVTDLDAHCRVAGVDAPAFVERLIPQHVTNDDERVSPGLMPRPSLSEIAPTCGESLSPWCRRG